MKVSIKSLVILSLFLLLGVAVYAQPGGGGPTTPTPIDGGVGLLIAAGAAYGYYKKRKQP